MVRAPLSLKKLVYLDGQKAVLYRSRMNPFLGRNFEAMDPLEWLARLADHHGQAPDPFLRLLRQSGPGLAKREGGLGAPGGGGADKEALSAELGAAHQQGVPADPLVCKGCAGPLVIVAYITDELSIRRILD